MGLKERQTETETERDRETERERERERDNCRSSDRRTGPVNEGQGGKGWFTQKLEFSHYLLFLTISNL